ncbi:carboxypeptidase regulatory-like domain-containing protein, partial [Halanaerobiaceae bacterium Z-7014]
VDEDKTVTVNMVTEAYDVTFEVVDGDNNPIDGAEVELGPLPSQTTDADGETVFEDVPAQEWGYTVTAAGFDDATGTVDVDEDKTVTVNMVTEAYDVTFEVVDGDGNPITGAEVELGPLPSQTTDADGETVFEDVPAQEWGYTVTAAGFDDATGTVDVDEDKTVTVNMVEEGKVVPIIDKSDVFVSPGNDTITFNVRDTSGNRVEGLDDKDEWKVELTVDGNSSIVWVLYAEDSVSGYPLQGGLDFQIRVEDIPKGTALRQVKVTYMGYDEDVIVVDGMSLDE